MFVLGTVGISGRDLFPLRCLLAWSMASAQVSGSEILSLLKLSS